MGYIFVVIGAIGLAVVFPPIIFVYIILFGLGAIDNRR